MNHLGVPMVIVALQVGERKIMVVVRSLDNNETYCNIKASINIIDGTLDYDYGLAFKNI